MKIKVKSQSRAYKVFVRIIGLTILIIAMSAVLPSQTRPKPAVATQPFDHNNCQYPYRWSNPADGCDNSDPAVPECTKEFSTEQGEKDCIAAFAAAYEPVEQSTIPATPFSGTPDYTSKCGGK